MRYQVRIDGLLDCIVDSETSTTSPYQMHPADARRVARALVIAADTVDELDARRAETEDLLADTAAKIAAL